MSAPVLGLISIGQTPRPDYERAFRPYAPNAHIRVVGALDGVAPDAIAEMTRIPGRYPLLVRLSDGRAARIDLSVIAPLVATQVGHLADEGAKLAVVMCAGGFPDIECRIPVVLPGRLLPAVLKSVCRTRTIGLVTPIEEQREAALHKWQQDGFHPTVTWAAPHDNDEMERAAKTMSDPVLEVVLLDCMGHDETYRTDFARRCGRPVMLAQSLVARVVGEWVAE
ncbi:MAG: AroM family protein [candidate division Zixibacteria bacterium]|nr:AroM family protein [candidate division Zixibacteria bacterium]